MNLLKKITPLFITTGISKINSIKTYCLDKLSAKKQELHQKRVEGKKYSIIADTQKHICKNCNAEYAGNYCFNCGQEANTHRLTWVSIVSSVLGGITNIASGFGFTMIELFTRPGYMINDFIRGKRISYARPFQMLFVLAAVYAISYQLLYPQGEEKQEKREKTEITKPAVDKKSQSTINKDISEGILTPSKNESDNLTKKDVVKDLAGDMMDLKNTIIDSLNGSPFLKVLLTMLYEWFSTNKALSSILFLPFITLGTKWAFRKSKYNPGFNFVEMLFVCSYMSCQTLIISIIFLPFTNSDIWYDTLLKILISLWTLHELFRNSKMGTIRKFTLSFLNAYIILILLGAFIIVLLYGLASLLR